MVLKINVTRFESFEEFSHALKEGTADTSKATTVTPIIN
jgi:hypothetical protein